MPQLSHLTGPPLEPRPLRSGSSLLQSRVRFISRTRRKVSIYWLDYQGNRVRYCSLNYGEIFPIVTYVSHPWIFRDQESGDVLTTSRGEEVYWPVEWEGGNQFENVIIGIPVYPLLMRCMQEVRKMFPGDTLKEKIDALDLPYTLKQDIVDGRDLAPCRVRVQVI